MVLTILIVMGNLWHNLQFVEGCQYLVEEELEEFCF